MSGRPSWKSAKIGLFRPFSAFFALFRWVQRAPGKSRKRRKKAFFLRYPQICLNPHLLNPHLRHPNNEKNLPKQFSELFAQTVITPSFKLNRRHAERVWANCLPKLFSVGFIGVGGFFWGGFLSLDSRRFF